MSTATKPTLTADDLLKMPEGDRYELVDGHLVERGMGSQSSYIGGRLFLFIGKFCEEHPQGWVFPPDCGYQCYNEDPNRVRKPDASFIRFGRLPGEQAPKGYVRIPPDLAVEVLSPDDLDYETDDKVDEYLRAGVRLVWVINPERQTVLIYRANGTIPGLRAQDELSGEDVLVGFKCRVEELFALPAAK